MNDDIEVPDDAPLQVKEALGNILHLLQQNPERYRCFGIWWWPVKALLKAAGYGPENLFYLGSYVDREVAALVPVMGLEATIKNAIEEYGFLLAYPHSDGRAEAPDGSLVAIIDADAGLLE